MDYETRQLIKQEVDRHKRSRLKVASNGGSMYGSRLIKCAGINIHGNRCGSWALMGKKLCYYHQSQKS